MLHIRRQKNPGIIALLSGVDKLLYYNLPGTLSELGTWQPQRYSAMMESRAREISFYNVIILNSTGLGLCKIGK